MISRPLFSMVAESMVIRRPITQVGCFNACSGVMAAKSARGVLRNGPPDAVSQISLDFTVVAHAHALVNRVVLAVDGQDRDVAFAGRGSQDFPGRHHAFFVRQPDRLPGEDRGMRGFKSGYANDRGDHKIRFGMRGAGDGPFAAVDDFVSLIPAWLSRLHSLAASSSVASEMSFGRQRTAWANASSMLRPAASVATW